MSTLTKLFIVLVFMAALVNFGVEATQFAMRIDWRDKFLKELGEHAYTIKVKNAEIESWKVTFENMKSQYNMEREKRLKLEEDLKGKEDVITRQEREINSRTNEYQILQQQLDRLVTLENVMARQVEELQKKVEEYKKNLELAISRQQSASQELLYARAEAERNAKDLAALEKQHVSTAKEMNRLKQTLAELERKGVKTDIIPVTRPLNAKVMSVSKELSLLILSVGNKDEVKVGDQFTVYRGDKYIATCTVDKVDETFSAAKIVYKKEDPRENDDATNTIK